ncbi:MAG: T9SS type A sorting domain-containing protein [Flavobacteriales bacterium]|nr:T9SS type A sorting domain-containing protein [Flavobacteriales bacterium]MCB9167470.1 T9SS type A sorting domain-containing protein [Flavobacteriales bacterium]
MRTTLRQLGLGLATVIASTSLAQTNSIYISGTVIPCTPGDSVHIQVDQGIFFPTIDMYVTLTSNCAFNLMVDVDAALCNVTASVPCQGAIASAFDSVGFNGVNDTAFVYLNIACGSGNVDCLGIPNGPNLPGTPCDDGDPNTNGDTWTANCVCIGNPVNPPCEAAFTVMQAMNGNQPVPWQIWTANQSTGTPPITYSWWLPDGSTSTASNPSFTFSAPGVYGICLTISADGGNCTDVLCDTIAVDSMGMISTAPIWFDCLGVLWGPNTAGTPCDDGDPNTTNDTWTANCQCVGQGGGNVDCLGIPGGTALPGTACIDTAFGGIFTGVWDNNCICQPNSIIDCLGVPGGTDLPGTPCLYTPDSGLTWLTGLWSPNCICLDTNNVYYDCLGLANGPNLPGTPCDDGDSTTVMDTWSAACLCVGVPVGFYDCNGVLNGNALPGTPCDDGNPITTNDTWDANCNCVGGNNIPCEADFWVLQAWDNDSLNGPMPIPNVLWIWNLSSGGSGTYSFFWNFGDGTSSTDPFPTHYYNTGGPYQLCLTIDDGAGCSDTYCDSISVDGNGMYTGLVLAGEERASSGFTINILDPNATGIQEEAMLDGIVTWPNPVEDLLNVAFISDMHGPAWVEVLDLEGRIVRTESATLVSGRNLVRIPTQDLGAGMYMVRISTDRASIGQRFVRTK